jgi:hypothetical protein
MHRKNMQVTKRCLGTDANRNFGFHWNEGGSSSRACAQVFSITSHYQDYHGPTAFSTPEARAITDFITTLGNVISYIDFHSYSQLWMHSYGYSCRTNPNDTLLTMGGKLATEALAKRYGTEYRYGSICKTIYRGLWVCDLFFKRMGIVWIGQLVLGA